MKKKEFLLMMTFLAMMMKMEYRFIFNSSIGNYF